MLIDSKLTQYFTFFCVFCTFIIACESSFVPESSSCYAENIADVLFRCRKYRNWKLYSSFNDWVHDESFKPDNQWLRNTFPVDAEKRNYIREVRRALFSVVYPTPFIQKSTLISYSSGALISILDIDPFLLTEDITFRKVVSGGDTILNIEPLAHRYGGHQFGQWAGQLGDGRAIMIGEYSNKNGFHWEMQLKGAGLTPYSRRGDGRAVLRSSIREFLCSEAMHNLGVPTSRAATITMSSETIVRDQFYDGRLQHEPIAVVLRLAESWFRIGSLEILSKNGEYDLLRKVIDFIIEKQFLHINKKDENRYVLFYREVLERTAKMVALWMSFGFTHGVCNTDNFSLLGITIDYGPFGFLDEYNPSFIPNSSDDEGMYRYSNQPDIGRFNMMKLMLALEPVLNGKQIYQIQSIFHSFMDVYNQQINRVYQKKFGFLIGDENDRDTLMIIENFLNILEENKCDFTMSFRHLSEIDLYSVKENIPKKYWALKCVSSHPDFKVWIKSYRRILEKHYVAETSRKELMLKVNPRYVLRNWMAEIAIRQASLGDFFTINQITKVLENPYILQSEAEEAGFASPPPSWAKELKVSCSS